MKQNRECRLCYQFVDLNEDGYCKSCGEYENKHRWKHLGGEGIEAD